MQVKVEKGRITEYREDRKVAVVIHEK